MRGLCKGCIHIQISLFPQLQAQIDIVIGHCKFFFVQTAAFLVQRFFHHQARPGDRHEILRSDQTVQIAYGIMRMPLVAVARTAVDAHDHTAVLNGAIRIKQLGTHAGHIGALAVAEHLAQKSQRGDLDIVVQQKQLLPLGKAFPKVIDSRKIKGALVVNHLTPGEFFRQLLIIGKCGGIRGVIFYHDHFVIVIPSQLIQAGKAAIQIIDMIFAGDQNADHRVRCQLINHTERPRNARNGFTSAGQAQSIELGVYSPLSRCNGIGFGFVADACRRAARMAAPHIQNLGNMVDLLRIFGKAQDQIMVLRAVKLAALLKTGALGQTAAEKAQMRDIIAAAQVVGGKIRLKMIASQFF